jgi:catechol 2,3-dioxygenase-like lactoylglutathione lyase family enzyme
MHKLTRRDALAGLAAALGPWGALRSAWAQQPLAQPAPLPQAPAAEPAVARPALGAIRALTITAHDLDAVQAAWTRYMGYRVVDRGRLPRRTAHAWQAPALAGRRYLVLGPASGEPTCLRFIDQPTPAGYSAAGTAGWNTIEITVQDSDELYERLKGSPFAVRAPPALVPTYSYLKAMAATGPAGEQLYLTWIMEQRPDLAVAKSFVGRCFIAVQSTPDLPRSVDFFRTTFGNVASPIRQLPTLSLSVVTLKDGAKIELDQQPTAGPARARVPGGLPPGLAMVSFECSDLARASTLMLEPPAENALEPFRGRSAAVMTGAAGELIELIETGG